MHKLIITSLVAALLLGAGLSWWVAGQLVAPVAAVIPPAPAQFNSRNIHLRSESGSDIAGWHFTAADSRGVVVLLHGIRSNRSSMLQRAEFLYQAGYSSVLIDFQAHGASEGKHITVGHLEKFDVLAAVNYAKQQHPGETLAIIGVSMGGAAALFAQVKDIDLLILESVYSDLDTAVHNRVRAKLGVFASLPAKILLAQLQPRLGISPQQLSPVRAIQSLQVPLLIISGTADLHTTVADSQLLYQHAAQPKTLWLIEGAGHEDLYAYAGEAYRKKILDLLARYSR